jgi:hypothetical protein
LQDSERKDSTRLVTVTNNSPTTIDQSTTLKYVNIYIQNKKKFITGQNEREETTQNRHYGIKQPSGI